MNNEELLKIGNKILTQVKYGREYFTAMGFDDKFREYVDFLESRQWGEVDDLTRNYPRPIFNFANFDINHKVAAVTGETLRMVYTPMEVPEDAIDQSTISVNPDGTPNYDNVQLDRHAQAAKDFTHYSEYVWEQKKLDFVCNNMCRDAATFGSGYLHYRWDNDVGGGVTDGFNYTGDLQAEPIKASYIFFGNPQDVSLQSQPWIIIAYRSLVNRIKREALANGISKSQVELITGSTMIEDKVFEAAKTEMIDTDKTDVYLAYWRDENGIVNHCKIANGIVISPPKTLSKHKLYPIANFIWEERNLCIYGLSELEGVIANQKLINWTVASGAMNANLTGNPKIIVKNDALKQQITNASGEIIYDKGLPNVENIKYMQPPQMTGATDKILDTIINLSRQFKGINEVATGEPFSKELNASAIIALQNQAKIPLDGTRKRWYQFREDCGRIQEEFYKYEFTMTRRFKTTNPLDGTEMATQFNGSQYEDVPMSMKIDIGVTSNFSDVLITANIEKWLQMGVIPFELALDEYPDSVVPFKEEFKKKYLAWQQQQMLQQQQAQQAQLQQQTRQQQQVQTQEKTKMDNDMAMAFTKHAMEMEKSEKETKKEK